MAYTKGEKTMKVSSITVEEINKLPIRAVPHYGITEAGAKHFGIRSEVSEEDGKTITRSYFPYYSQNGKLSGYKGRNWTKGKKEKGHIFAVGDVFVGCKMFGQKQVEDSGTNTKTLMCFEGEGSVIAAWQAITESLEGTKWAGKITPAVVGLSCGTANAVACISANEDFIRKYDQEDKKIVLGFDNDQATQAEKSKNVVKGWDAIELVAGFLLTNNIYVYDYGNYNDPRDIYLEGDAKALGNMLSFDMKKFHPEKIVSCADVSLDDLLKPREEGFYVDAFPDLMGKIHGFRRGELVVVTAPSGAGKSTFVSEVSHDLMNKHGQRLGMIYLEEMITETINRQVARKLKVNYNGGFKFNPLSAVTKEQYIKAYDEVKDKMYLVDHFGSMLIEQLIRKIRYMEHVDNCDFVILDHLSMVFSGTATNDERKLIDMLMTALGSYVSSSNLGIIAVSHIKRKDNGPVRETDEPYWVRVSKEDLRGSASLEQVSWVIIAIEPEIMPDRSRGRIRLVVLKNRPWSSLGECDTLSMDEKTGLFKDASDDIFADSDGSEF